MAAAAASILLLLARCRAFICHLSTRHGERVAAAAAFVAASPSAVVATSACASEVVSEVGGEAALALEPLAVLRYGWEWG